MDEQAMVLRQASLEELATDIRDLEQQAQHHAGEAIRIKLEIGGRLIVAKSQLPHGDFLVWLGAECNYGREHAWRLMHLARNVARVQHLPPDVSLRGALDAIGDELRAERQAERAAQPRPAIPEVELTEDVEIVQADASDLPIPDESVDLVVTSPPYGLGIGYADTDDDQGYGTYMEYVRDWARELYRVAGPQGRLCLNIPIDVTRGGQQPIYADWLEALRVCGWRYRFTIIWTEGARGNLGKSVARGSVDSPSASHITTGPEVVLVCHKGDWNLRRLGPHDLEHDEWLDWTNGVWEIAAASPSAVNHPAPFPEELPRRCIALFSFRGDVVLDPFVGSGTTGVVATRMGRRFYGFDHSAQYVAQARARVAKEQAA